MALRLRLRVPEREEAICDLLEVGNSLSVTLSDGTTVELILADDGLVVEVREGRGSGLAVLRKSEAMRALLETLKETVREQPAQEPPPAVPWWRRWLVK